MPRVAKTVDVDKLQQTINDLEADNLFNSQSELWEAVKMSDWGKKMKVGTAFIYQTVIKNNITFLTASAKGKGRKPASESQTIRPKSITKSNDVLDVQMLINVFTKHGITVFGWESVLKSANNDPETNDKIGRAWSEMRLIYKCPKISQSDKDQS